MAENTLGQIRAKTRASSVAPSESFSVSQFIYYTTLDEAYINWSICVSIDASIIYSLIEKIYIAPLL